MISQSYKERINSVDHRDRCLIFFSRKPVTGPDYPEQNDLYCVAMVKNFLVAQSYIQKNFNLSGVAKPTSIQEI